MRAFPRTNEHYYPFTPLQLNKKYCFDLSALLALFFAITAFSFGSAKAQFREEADEALVGRATLIRPISECDGLDRLKSASPNELTFFTNDDRGATWSAYAKYHTIPGLEGEPKVIQRSHKSGFLAGLLSFILPGLGEYYVGDQIWRGIIFTALDAGLLYGNFRYVARGNDSNAAFQNFSDTYWSQDRYAKYLDSLLIKSGHTPIGNSSDLTQINKAEDTLNLFGFPNFTHNLVQHGTQQYYELISKYIQFTKGWQDAISNDPTQSPEYQRASYMRDNMNYQFQVASDFLYGMLLNRVLSAIDAVLLARDHNSPVHLEGELHQSRYPDGMMGFIPTAHISYKF